MNEARGAPQTSTAGFEFPPLLSFLQPQTHAIIPATRTSLPCQWECNAIPRAGELLSVGIPGAYGFTMASNYNARPRPAEVMVDSGEVHLIRERENYEDLVRGEVIP